ncbi:hypothetical protein GE061_008376 [Apolygus lucorum]|uniref:Uncharacterized protein n=1 Tax=Apolygus lucorum TaxID=248454 RepID=A0A8S9WQX1_APOLU|nr:hypothetical protein GE061_008376 [Apolygus lucorum]
MSEQQTALTTKQNRIERYLFEIDEEVKCFSTMKSFFNTLGHHKPALWNLLMAHIAGNCKRPQCHGNQSPATTTKAPNPPYCSMLRPEAMKRRSKASEK